MGIRSVTLKSEAVKVNPSLWKRVDNAEFQVIYATPEILLLPTSYFFKKMLHNQKSPFIANLVTVAVDECHIPNESKLDFRPCYSMLGRLRNCLPNATFAGFSATLTPVDIKDFARTANLNRPAIIHESVRRENVAIWVAPITGEGWEDLKQLIPHAVSEVKDIPMTLVFVNGRLEANHICQWLRKQLPSHLQSEGETIVRAYSAPLCAESKAFTINGLMTGIVRIAVTTEALGLGVHIPDIKRVVVWKLYSNVTVPTLYQRVGRAGRGTSEKVLGLIFVSKTNMQNEEKNHSRGPNKNKIDVDHHDTTDNELETVKRVPHRCTMDFEIQATKDNWSTIVPFLPSIYSKSTKHSHRNGQNACESSLAPGVRWTIHVKGCRHVPIMVALDDKTKLDTCSGLGCDECFVQHLASKENIADPPVLHGISLGITLTYRHRIEIPPGKKLIQKTIRGRPSTSRLDTLQSDILQWCKTLALQLLDYPYLHISMVLSDKAIQTIKSKIRCLGVNEEEIKTILSTYGYHFPTCMLTPYIPELVKCIADSLVRSQPPA